VVDPAEAHHQAGEYDACVVVGVLHLDIAKEDGLLD
jgi:hypothetical protein